MPPKEVSHPRMTKMSPLDPFNRNLVYYEEINRERKRILIYECQCNERLKTKTEGSTRLTYTGLRGGLEHTKIEG
jgi:hypothetical protein